MRKTTVRRDLGLFFVSFLLAASSSALVLHAGQKKAPAGSLLIADKGKLNLFLDGQSIGHEEFDIAWSGGGWVAKGTTRLAVQGSPPTTVSGTLTLRPNGAPVSYDWTSQTDKTNSAHIDFANGVAKMLLQMQGAHSFEQDLTFGSPMVVVLDNNLYHQYAILARLYDWAHRGEQSFSVIVPQQLTPGTIKVEAPGALTAEGKSYEGLKVTTEDIELTLYLDPNHKLMRLEVPASKAAVVRE